MNGKYEIIGFIDDMAPDIPTIVGFPVLGRMAELECHISSADCAVVALGNNELRRVLSQRVTNAGVPLVSIIHPKAVVSPTARLSPGCAVMAGAIVGAQAQIGIAAILNCGSVVDHDAMVGDYGHLGVNSCIAGGSSIGDSAWVQAGAAVGYGIHIGDGEVVSAAPLQIRKARKPDRSDVNQESKE
jgi:sugar O-acyltransferase (sialic acid O-acetyltransferase NeuD family)